MTANWTKDKRSGSWVVLAAVEPGDSLPETWATKSPSPRKTDQRRP